MSDENKLPPPAECFGEVCYRLKDARERGDMWRERAERAESRLQEVERDALVKGVRISLPTDTMEQQFGSYERRGYERGFKAASDQLAADAARYRWLRKGYRWLRKESDDIAVVRGLGTMDYGMSGVAYTYSEEIDGDDLDAAIDAAIAARTASEKRDAPDA